MAFTCYQLKCRLFGDTYIGVTGQPITRRSKQHYRSDKFPDGFDLEVLAVSDSRSEINRIERDFIVERKPTLNRSRGGNSVGGYYSRREKQTVCKFGHPLTEDNVRIQKSGHRRCLTCYRAKEANYEYKKSRK